MKARLHSDPARHRRATPDLPPEGVFEKLPVEQVSGHLVAAVCHRAIEQRPPGRARPGSTSEGRSV